jgi:hypothetical protein
MLLLVFGCSGKTESKEKDFGVVQQQKENETSQNRPDTLHELNDSSVRFDSISKVEFKGLSKKSRNFLDSQTKATKIDGCIRIINHLGTVVREYRDSLVDTDDTDQKLYKIIGEFKGQKITVISVQYYETGEYLLVNNETGEETFIWGYPKLSSNNKYLFVGSCALGYDEFMPNGFQIWELKENNSLKLLHEIREKEWCINEFYWIGNKSLAIETKKINGQRHYLKLSF